MSESKQHLVFPLKIEVLSPVHIGSGHEISAMGEYIPTTERIIFPDEKKLMEAIRSAGKLNDYIDIILNRAVNTKTFDLLDDWGIKPEEYGVERELQLNRKTDITGKNDILHLHIKVGNNPIAGNRIYLPGSSLKGAIRNALIYGYLLNNKSLLNTVERKFEEALYSTDPRNTIRKVWEGFEKSDIISTITANAIRLADSQDVLDNDVSVEQVVRRSFGSENTEGFDYLMECMATSAEVRTQLSIYQPNNSGGDGLKWDGIEKFNQSINAFSLRNLDFELKQIASSKLEQNIKRDVLNQINVLKEQINQANNKYCILRLGKGKTKLFQTILLAFDERLMMKILELYRKEDHESLPQSRLLTAKDNQLLGWVKVAKQEVEAPKKEKLTRNQIDQLVANETVLKAYFIETKLAEIHINDVCFRVQMVNKFKKIFDEYAPISVLVKQLKNNGDLNQVELIDQ